MTFSDFLIIFPDEEAAIDYFIHIRYGGFLACPHCGTKDRVYRRHKLKKLCQCKNCNNSFSPF
ncbi:MAG: transposase [Treponema sp.]|nr:transposase [Treponema sp.]